MCCPDPNIESSKTNVPYDITPTGLSKTGGTILINFIKEIIFPVRLGTKGTKIPVDNWTIQKQHAEVMAVGASQHTSGKRRQQGSCFITGCPVLISRSI